MKKSISVLLATILLEILISASMVEAGIESGDMVKAGDLGIFIKASYKDWTEKSPVFGRNGEVREFGPFIHLGIDPTFSPTKNLSLITHFEIFVGLTDYHGEYLIDRSFHDAKSIMPGLTLEEVFSYKFRIGNYYLSPFAGLGVSAWWRSIAGEFWITTYGRIGIQFERGMFFAKTGLLLPIYTEAHGSWVGIPWVNHGQETKFTVYPKGLISPFAEIGFRRGSWGASISAEIMEWERSGNAELGGGNFSFQPPTKIVTTSIKIEYLF